MPNEFDKITDAPWVDCPHDFTKRLLDLVAFTESVLENFTLQVDPADLSQGERHKIYARLGLLHETLLDAGRHSKPDQPTVLMN